VEPLQQLEQQVQVVEVELGLEQVVVVL